MDATTLTELIKNYLGIAFTVFTAIVTGASILLRMVASFIKSVKDYRPDYVPSKGLIFFMAFLSALSQNSITASNIIAESKGTGNASAVQK